MRQGTRGFRPASLLSLAALLFAASALAENIAVDGVTAAFELLKGYCSLGHEHPVDKAYCEQQGRLQEGHNKIVVYGVPCKSIDAIHNGGTRHSATSARLPTRTRCD